MNSGAPDLLEAIVSATTQEVGLREDRVSAAALERRGAKRTPRGSVFKQALSAHDFNVIAECKRRSPSRGVLRPDYHPARLARAYEEAGAVAVSVLTESAFFDGALEHLTQVRAAVRLPLLRKDFVVSEYQIFEARAAGADAVLLIVAALDDHALRTLHQVANDQGLAVLVEVHDAEELSRALDAGAEIVGVNNRNLRTLEVDLEASRVLISKVPETVISVAESGLRTGADLATLRRTGYDAFLIGESLMSHDEPGQALRALLTSARTGVA